MSSRLSKAITKAWSRAVGGTVSPVISVDDVDSGFRLSRPSGEDLPRVTGHYARRSEVP